MPVEPIKRNIESKICGFCDRMAINEGKCFDNSPCTQKNQDCNNCKWL
jgi:hypothetical protein